MSHLCPEPLSLLRALEGALLILADLELPEAHRVTYKSLWLFKALCCFCPLGPVSPRFPSSPAFCVCGGCMLLRCASGLPSLLL